MSRGDPRRSARQTRSELVAALDVGSSKIACLIAELSDGLTPDGAPQIRVLGIGHQRARGVIAGAIVDHAAALDAVRATVDQAERRAGVRLEGVSLAVGGLTLQSATFAGHVAPADGIVRHVDIACLDSGASAYAARGGAIPFWLSRLGYRLDGRPGIEAPLGLAGARLSADHLAIACDAALLANLTSVVEGCYLAVDELLPSALASGLAATTPVERDLGVVTVDIGAGVTTIAGFADGALVASVAIADGGHRISADVARALDVSVAQAERIKVLYGSLSAAASDGAEFVAYPVTEDADGASGQVSRRQIGEIVRQSLGGVVDRVGQCLGRDALGLLQGRPVVLCGGVSQTPGIGEFAAGLLGRPVRQAGMAIGAGMPGVAGTQAYAVAVGLVLARRQGGSNLLQPASDLAPARRGYLGRVGNWLRESF